MSKIKTFYFQGGKSGFAKKISRAGGGGGGGGGVVTEILNGEILFFINGTN